jgi:hypothetical protein
VGRRLLRIAAPQEALTAHSAMSGLDMSIGPGGWGVDDAPPAGGVGVRCSAFGARYSGDSGRREAERDRW